MISLVTFFVCACAGFLSGWMLLGVVKFDEGRLAEARKWRGSLRERDERIAGLKSGLAQQRETIYGLRGQLAKRQHTKSCNPK